jgi:gliding motility-associated-like protein
MNCLRLIKSSISVFVRGSQVRMVLLLCTVFLFFSTSSSSQTTIGLTIPTNPTTVCQGTIVGITGTSNNPNALFVKWVRVTGGTTATGPVVATTPDGSGNFTYSFNFNAAVVSGLQTTHVFKMVFGPTSDDVDFETIPPAFETSNTLTITVNPNPTATITALGGITTACQNAPSPTVNITGVIGTAPFTFTYRITDPLGNVGSDQTVQSIGSVAQLTVPTNGTTGTYTYRLLQIQDASSTTCTNASTATLTMTINPNPTIAISPFTPTVCEGASSFDVQYLTTNSPDRYSIVWAGAAITQGFPDVNPTMTTANLTTMTGTITINISNTAPAGTYSGTLTVRNNATMCSFSGTAQLVVNPLPVLGTITGVSPVCVGSTLNLSNSLTGGTWTIDNSNATIGSITGVLTGSAAGTSIVTYSVTNGSGCSSLTTTTVTVNALPVLGTITGVSPVCVGSTLNLSNSLNGGAWTVDNSNATIGLTTGVLTGSAAGTSIVTYSVTNGSGCSSLTTTTVTVNALPVLGTITGVSPVCIGSTLNLSNSLNSGSWTVDNSNATIGLTTGVLTGSAAGTTIVSYSVTNVQGCSSLTTTTVTVNALPVLGTITGVSPVCVGSTLNLSNSLNGGSWTVDNSNATIGLTTGVLTGSAAGTTIVSYSVTNVQGCSSLTTTTVTVNALPVLGTITGVSPVCVGSTLNLSNSLNGGSWTVDNSNATIGLTTGVLTGSAAGTTIVSYSVTNVQGCSSLTTTTVTVNALPVLGTITGVSPVCVGSTLNLSNSLNGGSWTVDNSNATIGLTTGVLTGSAAGTTIVSYSVTNVQGCSSLTTTTITVNALPIVNAIAGATAVCVSSTINLTNTTLGGIWSVNNANATINTSGVLTGTTAGTTTVAYAVTDVNNCTTTVTANRTVNGLPTVAAISGANAVCVGSNISLTNATPGGVWSVNNANATINTSGVLTGTTAGTTTVAYAVTDVNNCTTTVTANRTVNGLPTVAAISGANAVCVGSNISLTNATPGGVWSVNNANATINTSGVLTGTTAGTTTVAYAVTDVNNCTTTVTANRTVNGLPTVAAISGSNAVCVGSIISLTNATPGGVWSVNNANATINTSGVLTGTTAGTTTVAYSVTDVNNCTTTVTANRTINGLPTVAAISGANAVCIGSNISLTNATPGGVWSVSNANATINTSGVLTGTIAGTTTVAYAVTDVNNCTTTVTANRTINGLPTVAAISGSNEVCVGSNISLTNATPGGVWSVNNANATINTSGVLTGTIVGTTTVAYAVTDINNCTTTVTANRTINGLPTVAAISGSNAVCVGSNIALTNASPGGVWSVNSVNATINNSGILNGVSSGSTIVSYSITDNNGCQNTASRTVVVNALPTATITASGPLSFCAGNSVSLTASNAVAYTWSNGMRTNSVTNITSSGTFSVTITDANGCLNTAAPVTVTVHPLPVLTVHQPAAVCSPGTVNITTAAVTAGSSAGLQLSYWTNTAATAPLALPQFINTSGTYYIRATETIHNCSVIQPVTVSILPQAVMVIHTPTAVCAPNTVDITATAITNGSMSGLVYTYFTDAQATQPLNNAAAINQTGTYYIKGTPAAGCSTIVPVQVTIHPPPTLVVTNPAAVCAPAQIDLSSPAITAGSSADLRFNYFIDAALQAEIGSPSQINSSGTYYIRATSNQTGCRSSMPVAVVVNPLPAGQLQMPPVNFICEGGTLNLTATGAASYQWLRNQQVITGANTPIYTATTAGTYTVRFISAQGCIRQAPENIVLEVLSEPVVDFSVTNACVGVTASFQNRSQTTNSGGINWLWEFGDGSSSNQSSTQYAYQVPGVYQVKLTASNPNCAVSTSKTMEYIVRAAVRSVRYPDAETLRGVAVTVQARNNIGNRYVWLPVTGVAAPTAATTSITVNETTQYTVAITSDIGCVTTDTILIKIIPGTDIFVPQGFTPNNDTQNDRLYPILVGMRQLNYFKVFNRWGNMLFSTNDAAANAGWNGVYLGQPQPTGAYTWIAEAIDLQGRVLRKTGTVLLLR